MKKSGFFNKLSTEYLCFGPFSVPCTDKSTWTKNKKLQDSYGTILLKEKKTSTNKQTINRNRRLTLKYSLFNYIVHPDCNEHISLNSILMAVFCTALSIVQYFAVLFVLGIPGSLLGTTTSLQQQTTAKLIKICAR